MKRIHHSSKYLASLGLAALIVGLSPFRTSASTFTPYRIASISQQEYDTFVSNISESSRDDYNRGLFLQGEGNLDGALGQFDQAIAKDPNQADYYFSRGLTYTDLGDYKQAIRDFTTTLRFDPTFAAAYFQRGFAHLVIPAAQVSDPAVPSFGEDLDPGVIQAIRDFSKALELTPDFDSAYYYRGLAHHIRGESLLANKDYQRAQTINPNLAQQHYRQGFPQVLVGGD